MAAMSSIVEQLAREWRQAGISEGDTLLLHSDIKRTLRRVLKQRIPISPQLVLESFLAAVGATGTLLLPLFNFDFARGVPFDIRTTPSQMGVLSEAGRRHPAAVRTGHPIYSFAAIGTQAPRFAGVDNRTGCGADSPFAMLRALHGKIAALDLAENHSMTFYHHVEEMHRAPYREFKSFTAEYRGEDGQVREKTYELFVRKTGVLTDASATCELAWATGLYRGDRPGEGTGLRVIGAQPLYDLIADIIQSGRARGMLYRMADDLA